jgi:CDP-4-dehydro-6-deoxyglucose reductase
MGHTLSLSRAARLAGVSRGVLQRQIREGALPSSDGQVASEDLARLYPNLDFEASGAFERVARIKEAAFGRRVQERALPSQEVLAQRLYEHSRELADARRLLQRYHALVVDTQAQAGALADATGLPAARELAAGLERGLADVLATDAADAITVMDDLLKLLSARVVVRPSGREFFVEGRETLLQAGLRAGLHLDYGCGNGSCGLCKARVVAGDVVRVAPCDYPLSEAERLQGHALLCVNAAASAEIVLETLEARGPDDIAAQDVAVRVRAVTPLAPDTLLLHLQTPRTQRLRFLAGQSVTLGASRDGADAAATYPVASCPCDDRNLHFHVARDAQDPLAAWLFAGAIRAGDTLNLRGPVGAFTLADAGRPLVFLACDTGFAPVRSLIEHAMAADTTEALVLGWLATRPDGHYLANQCRAWADSFDTFRYVAHADADLERGAADLLDSLYVAPPLVESDFYVAGPGAFVECVAAALVARGVAAARIRS